MSSFLPAALDCLTATVLETISHVQTPVRIQCSMGCCPVWPGYILSAGKCVDH